MFIDVEDSVDREESTQGFDRREPQTPSAAFPSVTQASRLVGRCFSGTVQRRSRRHLLGEGGSLAMREVRCQTESNRVAVLNMPQIWT